MMSSTCFVKCCSGDLLLPGAYHDLCRDAALGGFACLAETTRQAGEILQFERDMFKDVCRPGAPLDAAQETTAFAITTPVLNERWEQCFQAFVVTGDFVGGEIFRSPISTSASRTGR